MHPALRITTGVVVGYFVVNKIAGKPLRRLAVSTAKGAMNLGGRVAAAGSAMTEGWQNIVEEARLEIENKKEGRVVQDASSIMDTLSDSVAGYMHKTAETIENMADRMEEYRDKGAETLEVIPD